MALVDGVNGTGGLPVTVIIPSYDRPALLFDTVQAILSRTHVPAELIIVDQSRIPDSELGALAAPHGCQVRYVHSPWPGASAARNLGARLSTQDVLVFLDDDLIVEPAWLWAFVSGLRREGPGAVLTGQVLEATEEGAFAPSCTVSSDRAVYSGLVPRDILSSGNMAIRRADLVDAGGFDERLGPGTRYPAAEDNDLGFRLLRSGCRIVYVPEAMAWHRAWRAAGDLVRVQWRYGVGQGAFYAKNSSAASRFIAHRTIYDLVRPVRSLPERLRSRRLRRVLGDLAFSAGVLRGMAGWRRGNR